MQAVENSNPLILAFVGDAVHTLQVRMKLAGQDLKISELHKLASEQCCAKSQAKEFDALYDTFSETEREIANRARNAKHNTVPKSCTLAEYQKATALEAVIGYRYLKGGTPC